MRASIITQLPAPAASAFAVLVVSFGDGGSLRRALALATCALLLKVRDRLGLARPLLEPALNLGLCPRAGVRADEATRREAVVVDAVLEALAAVDDAACLQI